MGCVSAFFAFDDVFDLGINITLVRFLNCQLLACVEVHIVKTRT